MALKRTSEPFIISTGISESAPNTFTQAQVGVNLNPLDQEVLLILAVDIDVFNPDAVTGQNTRTTVSVSTSSQTGVVGLDSSACIATASNEIKTDGVAMVAFDRLMNVGPSSSLIDYVSILATNDFFIQTLGANNTGAKGGNVRMWCVRAKADSATYAALVNSELLSA